MGQNPTSTEVRNKTAAAIAEARISSPTWKMALSVLLNPPPTHTWMCLSVLAAWGGSRTLRNR